MKISKELISESEIQSKINEIGDQINEDYEGQDLLIIGILKGAFITISDLAKRLKVDVSFDFMSVSSYEGTETSGQVKIEKDLDIDISMNTSKNLYLCNKSLMFILGTKIDYIELNNGNTLKLFINPDFSIYDEKSFKYFKKYFKKKWHGDSVYLGKYDSDKPLPKNYYELKNVIKRWRSQLLKKEIADIENLLNKSMKLFKYKNLTVISKKSLINAHISYLFGYKEKRSFFKNVYYTCKNILRRISILYFPKLAGKYFDLI